MATTAGGYLKMQVELIRLFMSTNFLGDFVVGLSVQSVSKIFVNLVDNF